MTLGEETSYKLQRNLTVVKGLVGCCQINAMASDQEIVSAFLGAVAGLSAREASAQAADVSHDDVARWRRGDWKRLTAAKRRALLRFLEERAEPEAVAPDYDDLGLPDVSYLKPRARAFYDQQIGSYVTRRWPPQLIERAANDLVNQIRGASTLRRIGAGAVDLTEDQQLIVLEAAAEWVEKVYGSR